MTASIVARLTEAAHKPGPRLLDTKVILTLPDAIALVGLIEEMCSEHQACPHCGAIVCDHCQVGDVTCLHGRCGDCGPCAECLGDGGVA